jgi:hypothetical protein
MRRRETWDTYVAWKAMKYRVKHRTREIYGDITICREWRHSFEAFLRDMGPRPSARHSLDRIDNAKGYCRKNCRWATPQQQAENRSITDWITYRGQTKTLTEWARTLGVSRLGLHQRLYRLGWSVEQALETPMRQFHGAINGNAPPPPPIGGAS